MDEWRKRGIRSREENDRRLGGIARGEAKAPGSEEAVSQRDFREADRRDCSHAGGGGGGEEIPRVEEGAMRRPPRPTREIPPT